MFGCPESELEKVAGASSTRKTRETFPQSASILAAHTRFANPRFEFNRLPDLADFGASLPVALNSGEPSYLVIYIQKLKYA